MTKKSTTGMTVCGGSISDPDPGFEMEYHELRSEQRFRYEHLNKLITGFVTFTTAVLTIGFGLSAVVSGFNSYASDCMERMLDSGITYELRCLLTHKCTLYKNITTALEFLQSIFFLTPIIYSKVCFNHSLENNIRISLISSYLGAKNPRKENWDNFRHEHGIKYFFGSFGSSIDTERVGDLSNMHRIISWLSIILGLTYGLITFVNCVMDGDFSDRTNCVMFIYICAGLLLSAIAHTLIVVVCNRKNIKRIREQSPEKNQNEELRSIIFYASKQRKLNMWLMFGSMSIILAGYLVIVSPLVQSQEFSIYVKYLTASIFILFAVFSIWQFPGYALECNIADRKIHLHDQICKNEP